MMKVVAKIIVFTVGGIVAVIAAVVGLWLLYTWWGLNHMTFGNGVGASY
jgi:hypothetical protein